MDEAFSKLDINGDGFISMEEILDRLPLETTDPDDDMESERFLQVIILPLSYHTCQCYCVMSQSPRPRISSTILPAFLDMRSVITEMAMHLCTMSALMQGW